MRTHLATGCIRQAEVARAFGMNRRTFARRLQEDGTTFRALLDALRFDAARVLLRGSAVSLEDVASQLGYADVTAFARAFRRWSGESPAVWLRYDSGRARRRGWWPAVVGGAMSADRHCVAPSWPGNRDGIRQPYAAIGSRSTAAACRCQVGVRSVSGRCQVVGGL